MVRAFAALLLLASCSNYTGHATPETLAKLEQARMACVSHNDCAWYRHYQRDVALEVDYDRAKHHAEEWGKWVQGRECCVAVIFY